MSWYSKWGLATAAYATAVIIALCELAILFLALNPNVPETYRAYYIDRTTTCLPQPTSGTYALGTEIDFRSEETPATKELLPCGWTGPTEHGRLSKGTSAHLRFAVAKPQPLTLMLEMRTRAGGESSHRVDLSINNRDLAEILVQPDTPQRFEIDLGADAVSDGLVDITLDLPDAFQPRFGISDVLWESVALSAAALTPKLDK